MPLLIATYSVLMQRGMLFRLRNNANFSTSGGDGGSRGGSETETEAETKARGNAAMKWQWQHEATLKAVSLWCIDDVTEENVTHWTASRAKLRSNVEEMMRQCGKI